ncbi:MAG: hypothetical protein KatS3mg092_0823 [Patescibacteria group bacterium]|nr:MAG: hypothetical protein KatS3mg092_0823 [Patescibacteria group bacterium]
MIFFKLLLTVSGVGPKTAFSIISFIKTPDLIEAIKKNDVDILTEVPGLGKKNSDENYFRVVFKNK